MELYSFTIEFYVSYLEVNAAPGEIVRKIRENQNLVPKLNIKEKSRYPMVVIKLVVNEPSEKRKRRQLFPTPAQIKCGQITLLASLWH